MRWHAVFRVSISVFIVPGFFGRSKAQRSKAQLSRPRRHYPSNLFTSFASFTLLHSFTSFILFTSFAASNLPASNWPQFRGPTGLGYTDETNLPLTWSGKTGENVLWKTPLPKADNPFSSPIVWENRVFLTFVLNNPLEHHVLCFQKTDGKLLWDSTIQPGPWLLKDLRGGYGAPTPCTDGKLLFVVFGSAVVAALDFEGKLIWRKELE